MFGELAASALGAIGSGMIKNWFDKDLAQATGKINLQNQQTLNKEQYQRQREFTRDQYGLMVQGMQDAGLNPLSNFSQSPAQASSAGSASSTPGNHQIDLMGQVSQLKQIQSQSQLNDALAMKAEAEAKRIESRLPGEVDTLVTQAENSRAQAQLNRALSTNATVDRALKKADIDLRHSELEGNKLKLGQMEVDLQYAKDLNDVYNKVGDAIHKVTGLDKSTSNSLGRLAAKGVGKVVDFGAKAGVARMFSKNISRPASGDIYNISTRYFDKKG